jgi:uncharacterized protein (TIGR03435 family)
MAALLALIIVVWMDERPGYDKTPLTTALAQQLGLRMEPAKAQIPVLVIGGIQRPSDN